MVRKWFMLTAGLLILTCGQRILGPDPGKDPLDIFDLLWTDYDLNYARFLYKGVDWQNLHRSYNIKIRNMDSTDAALAEALGEMLAHLKDQHAILITPEHVYRYERPQDWRNIFNFEYSFLARYLTDMKTQSVFTVGVPDEGIVYLHIQSFEIGDPLAIRIFDQIVSYLRGFDGLILDVRNNLGGNIRYSREFASRFVDERRMFATWRFRSGDEHMDLTEPVPDFVSPGGSHTFTRPIVLLTNRNCASAAEDFVMRLRICPHVTTMGDTTSGGLGGDPVTRELPNGWVYRLPTGIEISPEYEIFEGQGIPPDRYVVNQDFYYRMHRDYILEQAMVFIKSLIGAGSVRAAEHCRDNREKELGKEAAARGDERF